MDERRIVGLDATAERVVHASARRAGNYGAAPEAHMAIELGNLTANAATRCAAANPAVAGPIDPGKLPGQLRRRGRELPTDPTCRCRSAFDAASEH